MIRLAILAFVGVAAIRRIVGAEADRQGRSRVWWVVTAGLFLLGAVAGLFATIIASVALGWAVDDDALFDGTAFLGGAAGGAFVALPAWMLLVSLRPEAEPEFPSPIVERSVNWARWSLVPLVPLALAILVSPLASLALGVLPGGGVAFVTEDLPAGFGGFVLADHTLDADIDGTVGVAPGVALDCDGHTISGTGGGAGVILDDGSTVRNCTISGFNTAVAFGGSTGATAESIEATGNRIGFYLVAGTVGGTVRDCVARGNEIGYLFEPTVAEASIEENVALDNWGAGFQVGSTTDSRFIGNQVIGGGTGVWLTDSHRNEFRDNTVTGARQWFSIGLEQRSSENVFRGNEVSGGGVGIAVFGGAHDNEFIGNELHDNAKGAHTDSWAGTGNVFIDNVAHHNADGGLWDDGVDLSSRYRGNRCFDNGNVPSVPQGLC